MQSNGLMLNPKELESGTKTNYFLSFQRNMERLVDHSKLGRNIDLLLQTIGFQMNAILVCCFKQSTFLL